MGVSIFCNNLEKVTEAEAELAAVNATITDIQTALAAEQAICDGTVTGTEAGTFYLHADHLGRPQFATDATGAVVWDMGEGVTPFGEGVNLAGAFAQRLMFPGQYADVETGEEITLSHNWHRTYDPTLGRYLQSDPIGLAGGFNRYAYGLGDPVSNIDPDGRIVPLLVPMLWGAAIGMYTDIAIQVFIQNRPVECINFGSVFYSGVMGAIPVGGVYRGVKTIKALGKKGLRDGATDIGASLTFAGATMGVSALGFPDCDCPELPPGFGAPPRTPSEIEAMEKDVPGIYYPQTLSSPPGGLRSGVGN